MVAPCENIHPAAPPPPTSKTQKSLHLISTLRTKNFPPTSVTSSNNGDMHTLLLFALNDLCYHNGKTVELCWIKIHFIFSCCDMAASFTRISHCASGSINQCTGAKQHSQCVLLTNTGPTHMLCLQLQSSCNIG